MSINNGLKWLYSYDWSCTGGFSELNGSRESFVEKAKKEMKAKPAKASSTAFKWFNTKAECSEGVSTKAVRKNLTNGEISADCTTSKMRVNYLNYIIFNIPGFNYYLSCLLGKSFRYYPGAQ
jgi:hypothetical protein